MTRLVNSLLAFHRENKPADVFASVATMNSDHMTKLIFRKGFCLESTGEKKMAQVSSDRGDIDQLSLGECFPRLKWLDVDGVAGKLKKLHGEYDRVVCELFEERRRQLLDAQEDDNSTDFSRALLSTLNTDDGSGFTYDQIKAAIADMYLAGIVTTAAVLTFTIAELMRHPDIKQNLVKELDDVVGQQRVLQESDLVKLNYLKMVVKESLRLHPPAPLMVTHMSNAPSVVAGYAIPANTRLLVNIYAIHRDPKSWEDPLAFNPERFADSSVDARGKHFELLPFGAGRRQCAGMTSGMTMAELTLARLFHSFDISLPLGVKPEDVDMTEKTGIASSLATRLRVVVSPRKLYSM